MAMGDLANLANMSAGYVGAAAGPLAGAAAANLGTAILGAFQGGREDYQVQFAFRVEIDGIMSAAFRNAGPFRWTTKVTPVREGGNNRGFVNLVNPGEFAPLVMKKGLAPSNNELFLWMHRLHNPGAPFQRANISVVMMNEKGDEAGRFNLYNAFPSKYELGQFDGKTNEVGIETLEITFDYFEFNAGGLGAQMAGQAMRGMA